jgi:hypothetical protein
MVEQISIICVAEIVSLLSNPSVHMLATPLVNPLVFAVLNHSTMEQQ